MREMIKLSRSTVEKYLTCPRCCVLDKKYQMPFYPYRFAIHDFGLSLDLSFSSKIRNHNEYKSLGHRLGMIMNTENPTIKPIEYSKNLPFQLLINQDRTFKKVDELTSIFKEKGISINKDKAFSCGSGITACILGLANSLITDTKPKIYDGSWAEYGLKY